jgi:enoyl-CoA hydratase/carnithine racemase
MDVDPNIVLLERLRDGTVAKVTLNRPEVLNAIGTATAVRLNQVLDDIEADAHIRCVIVTGAGERAFSTGGDLKERNTMTPQQWTEQHRLFEHTYYRIRNLRKPIFAAVNGFALAGGLELAMQTDFIIAADHARFGQPEVTRGIMPGAGGTQNLPRRIPRGMALQLLMTGEAIDAEEALRLGLVNAVVALAELLPLAEQIAARIAANSPLAVQQAKKSVRMGLDAPIEQAIGIELECYAAMVDHPDRYEGVRAFNEKRPPNFQDAF